LSRAAVRSGFSGDLAVIGLIVIGDFIGDTVVSSAQFRCRHR